MLRTALALTLLAAAIHTAPAALIITEVVTGSSGSMKYVEILNDSASPVDLNSPQIFLRRFSNGSVTATNITLNGTIPAHGLFLIANNQTDIDTAYGTSTFVPSQINNQVNHNGDDAYDLWDGTTILDGFAKDWCTGTDPGNPASNGAYCRVPAAYPNTGDWGGTSSSTIGDGTTSPSGAWIRRLITASNGNVLTATTPFAIGPDEVPVELSSFSIE